MLWNGVWPTSAYSSSNSPRSLLSRVIFDRRTRRLRSANVTPFPGGPCLWRARSRGWHQIKVFWDRSNSVRVQGHLPRPDEPLACVLLTQTGSTLPHVDGRFARHGEWHRYSLRKASGRQALPRCARPCRPRAASAPPSLIEAQPTRQVKRQGIAVAHYDFAQPAVRLASCPNTDGSVDCPILVLHSINPIKVIRFVRSRQTLLS
jgi:hypothetical protein